ncbi:MAG: hypothetical protein IJ106_12595 [Parasporobacterium sp.]|nr:hypothetical protein [Parasporobacterium sp.]
MTIEEIHHVEKKFIAAAKFAKHAHLDGVQIHAAHTYLILPTSRTSTKRLPGMGVCLKRTVERRSEQRSHGRRRDGLPA